MGEVSAGRVEALTELYDRYCDRAYRVALSVCRDDGQAQDAVQDAFLSVWRSRVSYRPERGTVAARLLRSVRYRAMDIERGNGRHDARRAAEDQLDSQSTGEDLAETVVRRETADRLQASLAMLPEAQQEVIALAYYGQLTHTEIAAQLGLPAGTVKGRMRLGLQKLQRNLERESVTSTRVR